ncbi:MAG: GAF domain-containing protein [Bdellovibrionales bacterium]|nr:GAF domain-containing protein [Bdellovibrionales bacterium]
MPFSQEQWEQQYAQALEMPIVQAALTRLEQELADHFTYHSLEHTKDVLREVLFLGLHDNLTPRELELLAIGAAYHDLGFIDKPVDNEWTGARYAREAMESFGEYKEGEIQCVENMILDTQLVETALGATQLPTDKLAKYLLDADLGNLGREDFFECTSRLQKELGLERALLYPEALRLMRGHDWLTPAAKKFRGPGQEKNITQLEIAIRTGQEPGALHAEDPDDDSGMDLSRLYFLAKLPLMLNSSLHLSSVCETAMEHLVSMTGAQAATIFLLNPSGSELSFWALSGTAGENLKNKKMPADKGVVGWVLEHQKSANIDDVQSDERFFSAIDAKSKFETKNLICVPLTVRGKKKLGALQILNKKGDDHFTGEDLSFVEQFSHQLALALDNALLFEESEKMRMMLETLDRRKAEMITVLSHEFKTPMSVIQTSADLLASGEVGSESLQQKMSETLVSGVKRLTKLLSQLKSLSQIQGEDVQLIKETLDANILCKDVYRSFSEPAQVRNITFEYEGTPDIHVEGDVALLTIVLSNLLSNAIRFTPDGGAISLRLEVEHELAHFIVQDSGIGIPESEQSLIFEKFYEVGSALYHSSGTFEFQSGGLGLGLAAVSTILQEHGAHMDLKSEEGKGSAFSFCLPIV